MEQRQVTFVDAIKMALQQNYCNFDGRSSRSEYWWFSLFTFILNGALSLIFGDGTLGIIISGVVGLALLLPGLGLCVRRLHDTNRSGWWYLLVLVPLVGWIILIVWFVKPSDPTPNQYGPVPNVY